jgi:hypothetical protein
VNPFELEPQPDRQPEWQPEPQPAGALEPPRRRPPTAVGTGKLPPRRPPEEPDGREPMPEDDGEPYPEGPGGLRRAALRLLAAYALTAAALLLWPLGWRAYAGAGALVLAQAAWRRAAARRQRHAPTRGSAIGERPPDGPHARSA